MSRYRNIQQDALVFFSNSVFPLGITWPDRTRLGSVLYLVVPEVYLHVSDTVQPIMWIFNEMQFLPEVFPTYPKPGLCREGAEMWTDLSRGLRFCLGEGWVWSLVSRKGWLAKAPYGLNINGIAIGKRVLIWAKEVSDPWRWLLWRPGDFARGVTCVSVAVTAGGMGWLGSQRTQTQRIQAPAWVWMSWLQLGPTLQSPQWTSK